MGKLYLKDYQEDVLTDLKEFIEILLSDGNIAHSYRTYWKDRGVILGQNDIGLQSYKDTISGVPRVTGKIPTAGGKTFIACNSIDTVFKTLSQKEDKVVVWFVPSDTILEQTLEKLKNPHHPYRQTLDSLFNHRVQIIDKESALLGTGLSPTEIRENLTIFVLSAASFIEARRGDQGPRAYRDNGYLEEYTELINGSESKIQNAGETSLMNVLAYLNPYVIIDESHNFTADLRVDMLQNINPCFIYELTATPRENANIISFVGADRLKKANMVKLPVIVHNDVSTDAVITNAITLRDNLERTSKANEEAGGDYIRPIVLFQAQPKLGDESETFEKIRKRLIEDYGIDKELIAVKTAEINEIRGLDLMSKDCKIRYIITINALKEGWDCPFAYILASLANRSSKIDVEQILGRILRQPYAKKQKDTFLNMSYVFTNSSNFQETVNEIINSLNRIGFSAKDYKLATQISTVSENEQVNPGVPQNLDDLFDLDIEEKSIVNERLSNDDEIHEELVQDINDELEIILNSEELKGLKKQSHLDIQAMMEMAANEAEIYENEITMVENSPFGNLPSDPNLDARIFKVTDTFQDIITNLKLPQFCVKFHNDIFNVDEDDLLDKGMLLDGFELDTQNSEINFDTYQTNTRKIDIDKDKDFTPTSKGLNSKALEAFRTYYLSISKEGKIRELSGKILHKLRFDEISEGKLASYVIKVLKRLNDEQLIELAANLGSTVESFKNKIKDLTLKYSETRFDTLVSVDKIFTAPKYKFSESIVLPKSISTLSKSLYREEGEMDGFEYRVIEKVADLDNVLFWHRNKEKSGFCINGYINHYPDFIIYTKEGKIIMLETKGDHLHNPDSEAKLKLGNTWASKAGNQYRYFMVFDNKPIEGALTLTKFIEMMKQIP